MKFIYSESMWRNKLHTLRILNPSAEDNIHYTLDLTGMHVQYYVLYIPISTLSHRNNVTFYLNTCILCSFSCS